MEKDSKNKIVAINGQKDLFEIEDGIRYWYKCPNCGDENVRWKNVYCEKCNCEFEWSGYKDSWFNSAKGCTCGAYVWKDGSFYHVSDCCCQVALEIEKS